MTIDLKCLCLCNCVYVTIKIQLTILVLRSTHHTHPLFGRYARSPILGHRYLVHRETIRWYIKVEGMTRAIINPLPTFLNPEILPESFHIFACPVDI